MNLLKHKNCRRVHITAFDGKNRKHNVTTTVYNATPEDVVKAIQELAIRNSQPANVSMSS